MNSFSEVGGWATWSTSLVWVPGPKEPAPDFEIQGPRKHGVPGLVQLYGIESPGLTASLALARMVREELS